MGVLKLKTWEPFTITTPAGEITCEVKRPGPAEAPPILRCSAAVAPAYQRDAAGNYRLTMSLRELQLLIPLDAARAAFSSCVRNVQGLEVDDQAVTTGAELFEIADALVLVLVLGELAGLAQLSADEGKDSGSPSTSSSDGASEPASPVSDASSTGAGDSPTPWAATLSPTEPTSSSESTEG